MCKQNSRKVFFSDLIENVESMEFIGVQNDKEKEPLYIVCKTSIITQADREYLKKLDAVEEEYSISKIKFTFPIGVVIEFDDLIK